METRQTHDLFTAVGTTDSGLPVRVAVAHAGSGRCVAAIRVGSAPPMIAGVTNELVMARALVRALEAVEDM